MPTPIQIRSSKFAGLSTLALVLLGPLSLLYVPSRTVVPGDAAATAALQIASPTVVRLGLAGELGIVAVELVMVVALYLLFRPISAGITATAALARFAMAGIQAANVTAGFAALTLFHSGDGAQRSAETLIELRAAGSLVWQVMFAMHCALLAVLIVRSQLVPRILGVSMGLSAVAYMALGAGVLVLPEHRGLFESSVVALFTMGEVPFFLWLLFVGPYPRLQRGALKHP